MKVSAVKARWAYLSFALVVIPIGLLARSMRSGADHGQAGGFIVTYLGDTLWAVMFFFFFAAARPRSATLALSAMTLVFTLSIETSQLYKDEPLRSLRGFAPTRLLLGTSFLWSDVACLIAGTLIAAFLHRVFPMLMCRSELTA